MTHKNFVIFKFQCPYVKFLKLIATCRVDYCNKTVWPTKYTIFIIWPFTENVCWPLGWRIDFEGQSKKCCLDRYQDWVTRTTLPSTLTVSWICSEKVPMIIISGFVPISLYPCCLHHSLLSQLKVKNIGTNFQSAQNSHSLILCFRTGPLSKPHLIKIFQLSRFILGTSLTVFPSWKSPCPPNFFTLNMLKKVRAWKPCPWTPGNLCKRFKVFVRSHYLHGNTNMLFAFPLCTFTVMVQKQRWAKLQVPESTS